MKRWIALTTLLAGALTGQTPQPASIHTAGSPFGIAWFFLYGYSGVPAATYMPALRQLGAGFTKVYLLWNQIEPAKGRFDWTAVDAFASQLNSPEEGLISLFSSSMWAVKRPSAMLPPSPAKNLDDYYRFVFEVVKRCKGRVRYFENDAEPTNPVYWSGTKEEFVAELKVFYKAVKDADPAARVIVGGYDGMFIPPGMVALPGQRSTPFPQQEAALAFFEYVLKEGGQSFDIFDLRLYGDPYTIVPRVEYMHRRMIANGYDKPVMSTEYGGPGLFEFAENRKYIAMVSTWSQSVTKTDEHGAPSADQHSVNQIEQLYLDMAKLAPQTQMFMQGCPPALDAKYYRIQSRGVVMRNLFALSAGVQKTLYWDLLAAPGKRDDLMNLMYGKIGLLVPENGELKKRTPTADAFERMTEALAGVRKVTRIPVPDQPAIFLFEVDRGDRGRVYVVWERRDAFTGEDAPPVEFSWPWKAKTVSAVDALGGVVSAKVADGRLHVPVSDTPIYLEPGR